MIKTGAEIVIECFFEQDVKAIFGYPGATILDIYEALAKVDGKIKHYLTSHEQGAAHAADGYARSTGEVGVCLATSGPGATNLVTGIATAHMDSIPVVFITGNVPTNLLGKDSFQEVDIAGITMPVTKHNYIVKDVSILADTIRKAFYIAKEGRPGPVLIDIMSDVLLQNYEYEYQKPREINRRTETIKDSDIVEAIKLIESSKKPLICSGGGVIRSGATEELIEFTKTIDCPVVSTSMGLSGYPATDNYYVGMVGKFGYLAANKVTSECDLLISVGARFSERVTSTTFGFAPNAKILHLDVDPAEINKNALSDCAVVGDLKEVLKILNAKINKLSHPDWNKRAEEIKNEPDAPIKNEHGCDPRTVFEKINELTKGEPIFLTDVGQHQMLACKYIKHGAPRHFITSGGLGTMGFGLGAGIGAKIANPDKTVINITGDGSFRMNCNELATAVEYDAKVIVIILNNYSLGMIPVFNNQFEDKRFNLKTKDKNTDFVALAKAFKSDGYKAKNIDEFENALREALKSENSAVIDVDVCLL